ncbi:MAG: serine/threonine protein kinase, partial [Planctomycetota bacterium]|nr:serine/threonine protein kinase [Planctomycetota bacterium]
MSPPPRGRAPTPPPSGEDGFPTARPGFVDRFVVLSEIGRGRNSIVYHGVDPRDRSAVAVKVVYAVGDKRDLRSLEAAVKEEANVFRGLKHPSIVGVKEAGVADGHAYLVFPFVQGITYEHAMPSGLLSRKRFIESMIKVAQAVHHAHEHGLIHRDLKPGNLIFGNDGEPYVLDFGLSWRRGAKSAEGVQSIVGTPAYMSPEQARGEEEKLTPASDVYSLGAILYEGLTGVPPLVGDTPWKTLQMAMSSPVPPPTTLNPDLSPGVEKVVLWCLEKDAGKRYPT